MNNKIKGNEIHIKIGGDHGGGSFKMCYQVVNVDKPYSKTNTTVFNIFEASDCRTNLKFSLSRFKSEIDLLQNTISREKQISVYLFGDYKFLCAICRITGATGRHVCLLCNVTRQGMSTHIKNNIEMQSLETLDSRLEKFKNHGSEPKFAKLCDNVIDQKLFNVPLDWNSSITYLTWDVLKIFQHVRGVLSYN
ncbi:uncharacterized protein LOC136082323 isoform X2 [Hydra vulgaris]|uniref:uncharacterized protein LOC136082323 isoform X2 n=1 Tax=Hydra vulgaris TaxID=6087 RepID=UPI0032EA65C5